MKIAMVFDRLLWGGIERVGVIYANSMVKNGFDVDIIILEDNPESIIEELDPKCNIIIKPFSAKCNYENFWPWLIEHDFFGLESLAFFVKYFLLKIATPLMKIRYKIWDKEYDFAIAFSGHIKDLTYVSDNYVKCKKKVGWVHSAEYSYNMISPGFFRLYKRIKNLVCISDMCDIDCDKWNKKFNIQKVKICNPCSIDTSDYDNEIVEELKDKYGDFCLMVGRVDQDKNQELIIDAFYEIKNQYGLDKKFIIVGDGPKMESLKSKVNKMGLQDTVFFMGTRADVGNFYKAAKIYTHAAPVEGFGMVYVEAMSFGVPVVTTDAIPGSREIFENGKYGIIVDNNDAHEMADAIVNLYNNDLLYNSLSEKGKRRCEKFNQELIEKQLIDYLNNL